MRTMGGILLILAGILAIAMPFVAGGATVLTVGVLMIAGGLLELSQAFSRPTWGQRVAWMGLGILLLVGGLLVVGHPLLGLTFLTAALATYFILEGILRFFYAARVAEGRSWLVLGGIVALLLGILILRQWPFSGMWAVGTLVGVDLLFAGFALLGTAEERAAIGG